MQQPEAWRLVLPPRDLVHDAGIWIGLRKLGLRLGVSAIATQRLAQEVSPGVEGSRHRQPSLLPGNLGLEGLAGPESQYLGTIIADAVDDFVPGRQQASILVKIGRAHV